MKIAFLLEKVSRDSGGMFSSLVTISQELSKKEDIQIKVFGAKSRNFARDLSELGNLEIQAFDILGPVKFGYIGGLKKALRDFNPDVIHNNGLWTYNSMVVNQMNKPFIVSPHGMLDSWALKNSYWKKILGKFIYVGEHLKKATCIHALNKEELDSIRQFGLNNPVFVIPNVVNINKSKSKILPLWEKIKNDQQKILLFLSRISEKKGLEILINGFKLLGPEKTKNWKLIIAGRGERLYERSIRELVKKLGLEEKILFAGEIGPSDKNSALHYSDALILPSYSEGMPLAILEAWANKLPVLMTKECNLHEGFLEGAAINICTNPRSISEGLEKIFLMKDGERREMGKKGYLLVKRKFNSKAIAQKLLDAYKWAIENHKKRGCF